MSDPVATYIDVSASSITAIEANGVYYKDSNGNPAFIDFSKCISNNLLAIEKGQPVSSTFEGRILKLHYNNPDRELSVDLSRFTEKAFRDYKNAFEERRYAKKWIANRDITAKPPYFLFPCDPPVRIVFKGRFFGLQTKREFRELQNKLESLGFTTRDLS